MAKSSADRQTDMTYQPANRTPGHPDSQPAVFPVPSCSWEMLNLSLIPTANLRFSYTAILKKVSLGDSNNEQ